MIRDALLFPGIFATIPVQGSFLWHSLRSKKSLSEFIKTAHFVDEDVLTGSVRHKNLSLTHLVAALDCAGDAIVVADRAGRVRYVNQTFIQLTGYSQSEVLGKKPNLWRSDRHNADYYQKLWACITAGSTFKGEVSNTKKDGSVYDALLTIAPILNSFHVVEGFVSTMSDVTSYKKLEDNLNLAWEQVGRESSAKTRNLAHISHDIRTPLNGILGILEIMGDGPQTVENVAFIATMRRASQNILALVNNLLDYSQIDAEKLQLDALDFDLIEAMKDVQQLLSPKAAIRKSQIRVNIPSEFPRLQGDAHRISRILQNLVGNAVKFTENGEINISLELLSESAKDCHLLLEIRDNGIGIKKEIQDQLFEQYTQADITISQKYGGTGLGLAISKKLVELMGGTIQLESELGVGTSFTIRLTLPKSNQIKLMPIVAISELVKHLQGLSVLVCEDDELSQTLIKRVLEKEGMKVDLAVNGIEGLNKMGRKTYDVAFVDFQMPFMDGIEMAGLVRNHSNPRLAKTPLIATTGFAHYFQSHPLAESGFDDFIVKPYTAAMVLNCLQRLLLPKVQSALDLN